MSVVFRSRRSRRGGAAALAAAATVTVAVFVHCAAAPRIRWLATSAPVLSYGTYLGGTRFDAITAMAVTSSGETYLAGWTESSDFPILSPYQATNRGGVDAFVAKFNAVGGLVYSTYLGGNGDDRAYGLAVDASGNAYVTGWTGSTNFPVLNALQATLAGGRDAFIVKLNSTGNALLFSTYLGGANNDSGNAIVLDASGNVYLTGDTTSANFPLAGAYQSSNRGNQEAFVAKLNAAGTSLLYSTYLGGGGDDRGNAIAVDASGNAYVAGTTSSTNFPVASPFQPAHHGGGNDAFVLKMNPAGSALLYSTYLGGSGVDAAYAIQVGTDLAPLLAGHTSSPDFPVAEAFQSRTAGLYDAFAAKLNPAGNGLIFSTYFGGSGSDTANAVGANAAGDAYLAGQTLSSNLPTRNPLQAANGGAFGGFLAVISSNPPCGGVGPQGVVTTATSGTLDFYVYNVPGGAAVYFPTWSALYGQDDLIWYRGVDQGGGTWRGSVNLGNHRPGYPDYGGIAVQAWLFGPAIAYCGSASFVRTSPTLPACTGAGPKDIVVPSSAGTVDFYVYGVQNATSVYFPTWSSFLGQDDLVWYRATDIGSGTWKATVNLANHRPGIPDYGRYAVHVWLYGTSNVLCSEIGFTRAP